MARFQRTKMLRLIRKYSNIVVATALLLVGSTLPTNAQRWFKTSSLEFGLLGGMSHYSGDLTQSFLETKGFKPSVGIISRYSPGERFTFRLSAQYGSIEGRDDWYEDPNSPTRRNLSFRSDLWDFTGALEVNLIPMVARRKSGVYPYLFTGASVFRFNPEAQFTYEPGNAMESYLTPELYGQLADRDGEYIELQPLGTEGQQTTEFNDRKRYALTQIAIPVGGGLKFKMNHKWTFGLEYGVRFTFTDYLDDVSGTYVDPVRLQGQYGPMSAALSNRSPQFEPATLEGTSRGDSDKYDLYGLLGISLTYRLYGNRPVCPTF